MSGATIESAMGYLELGLVDLAEAEVSRIDITQKETREIIEIKRQIAFARGNFSAVRDLSMASIENSQDPAVDMYAISLAGNSEWLYSRCIGFESMCQSDYLYWFNRACFACQAGNFRDSLESLRKGFTLSDRNHAQAFLDHDLESLWNWMGVTVLTDELAETLIHPIWLKAMETHLSTSMEIELSLAMKSAVPEKYRRFLEPMCLSLRTGPKISAGEYQGYLKWQKAFARPRVDALQRAYDRARDYIVSRQPDFASHQAQIGNFTASRYHILHFLASQPQDFSHVAFLRNLGMGYLLDDVEPAIREDPSFVRKIESVAFTRLRSEEDTQVFDEIGAKVRETVLFQIRLAGCHRHFGRESLAIPHYINGLTRWPDDAVCYSGLVDAYARLGRWEEARLCFRAAPTHYRQFRRYGVHLQQIKEESVEVEKGAEVLNFLGQRDLGGLLLDPGVSNKQGPQ